MLSHAALKVINAESVMTAMTHMKPNGVSNQTIIVFQGIVSPISTLNMSIDYFRGCVLVTKMELNCFGTQTQRCDWEPHTRYDRVAYNEGWQRDNWLAAFRFLQETHEHIRNPKNYLISS